MKKGLTLFFFLLLTVALSFCCTLSCSKGETYKVSLIKFTNVSAGRLTLYEGESFTLKWAVEPAELKSAITLSWTSSDAEVVSVRRGALTAMFEGEATITASYGGVSTSVKVQVLPIPVTSFKIPTTLEAYTEEELLVEVSDIEPAGASFSYIDWSIEDNAIAQCFIRDGKLYVKGLKAGTTKLIGKSDDFQATCTLIFKTFVPVTSVKFSVGFKQSLAYEEELFIHCAYSPDNASLTTVTWKVLDESLFSSITKNGADITLKAARKVGKTLVQATVGGKTAAVEVEVYQPPLSKLSVPKVVRLAAGSSWNGYSTQKQLSVTRVPSDNTETLTYESSDPSVATISSTGVLSAVGHGVTQIRVKRGSISATGLVYVYKQDGFVWDLTYYVWDESTQSNIEKVYVPGTTIVVEDYRARVLVRDRAANYVAFGGEEPIIVNDFLDEVYSGKPTRVKFSSSTDGSKETAYHDPFIYYDYADFVHLSSDITHSWTTHLYGYPDGKEFGPSFTVTVKYSPKK